MRKCFHMIHMIHMNLNNVIFLKNKKWRSTPKPNHQWGVSRLYKKRKQIRFIVLWISQQFVKTWKRYKLPQECVVHLYVHSHLVSLSVDITILLVSFLSWFLINFIHVMSRLLFCSDSPSFFIYIINKVHQLWFTWVESLTAFELLPNIFLHIVA